LFHVVRAVGYGEKDKRTLKLSPREIFETTIAIPMTIQSVVRAERSFALFILTRKVFDNLPYS
jgi:hypothetical protein